MTSSTEAAAAGGAPAAAALEEGYAGIAGAAGLTTRAEATVRLILDLFAEFYRRFNEGPWRAKAAFERCDAAAAIAVSRERLALWSAMVVEHAPRLQQAFPELAQGSGPWELVELLLLDAIAQRYEADIIFAFAHSLRRYVDRGIWRAVAYEFPPTHRERVHALARVWRRIPLEGLPGPELLEQLLQLPGFSAGFRDLAGDAVRVHARLQAIFAALPGAPRAAALDLVDAGFYRERTCCLVGRWVMPGAGFVPLVVVYRNGPGGIYVDAVLHEAADVHQLFSSALANMHATTQLYYQTCVFLYSLMPRRPLGHHYTTIGYNHVGKVAILNEIVAQLRQGAVLQRSPGKTGTVAIGFTSASCDYHLKVIRDRPMGAYKWGAYPGVDGVLAKYRRVHEIDRAGSMLDTLIYQDLRLDRALFDPALLEELLREARASVQLDGEGVLLGALIVQLKIVPLPVFLQDADEAATEAVVRSLGDCIRNNAATNVFNRDLDCRNYGVGRYGRVLLFDYDALEELTTVKLRTNLDREPGDETVPDWFFEDGVVFLPEEIEYALQLGSERARRGFRRYNAELATLGYWQDMQQRLLRNEVPELRSYPDSTRIPLQ